MPEKNKTLIPPGLEYIADNIISRQNILGASKEEGAKWANSLHLAKRGETVFFAGCGYQYSSGLESMMTLIQKLDKSAVGSELPMGLASLPKKFGVDLAGMYRKLTVKNNDADGAPLRDAVKVLQRIGLEPAYLAEEEPCCGAPLHSIGMEAEFAKNAVALYKKLKSLGVKRIIGMVPSCTYSLARLVPEFNPGFDIEVRHFAQVVHKNLNRLQLRFPRDVKVAYHDPCQTARYLGIVEEPRQILKAIKGIELLETPTCGKWATCCGGGGGFEAVFPEFSQMLAVSRVRELTDTGAEMLVTNCPGCELQLKSGLKETGKGNIEVLDLAQVVAMAMAG